MSTLFNSTVGKLRLAAILEGCSFLLFSITMPLKYKWGIPQPNYVVGMIHGLLFILYIMLVVIVAIRYRWTWLTTGLALLASVVPFGTFYADMKIFRKVPIV